MIYEVDREKKIVWKCDSIYKDSEFAFRLKYPAISLRGKNGKTMITDGESGKALEVDKNCNILWESDYGPADTNRYLTNFNRLSGGNRAVAIYHAPKAYGEGFFEYIEIAEDGRTLKNVNLHKVASEPIGSELLPNGHILASYSRSGVVEFDTLGNIVWSYQMPDSVSVLYEDMLRGERKEPIETYNAFRFSNGNTVTYSLCLGIYVIDPIGKVLWRVKYPTVKSILGVQYLQGDKNVKGDHICHVVGIVDR